jgi:hypothetical protein
MSLNGREKRQSEIIREAIAQLIHQAGAERKESMLPIKTKRIILDTCRLGSLYNNPIVCATE